MSSTASRPSSKVATRTTRSPSGTLPTTSEQLSAGARKKSAPALRAPTSFCRMPPIGPTVPSSAIVPVPAIRRPPVSSPGVRTSRIARLNISPADGPPTPPVRSVTSTGRS
jgi:hypothetical protein